MHKNKSNGNVCAAANHECNIYTKKRPGCMCWVSIVSAAHSLFETPEPPSVTILCRRPSLRDAYHDNRDNISLEARSGEIIEHRGYEWETLGDGIWYSTAESGGNSDSVERSSITDLIVAVKATQTTSALQQLKHRLTPQSNILFVQNGCGMIDEVNDHLFPHPTERPNYMVGVNRKV
ncbi:2-dehydropantoate 2-reductase [Penicillium mononematosum]|uniref:2-dehydropantoate 2-reductase n=1 Tax=Penicillium mononematosum TaxID=268346 RepID=UPI0025494708|nr:2-dehydropantoate 2-reductase [Penicillium mononematosum]KAJ6185162.1 2-dehydropantoate 2-reductase [Penicillium mononematosum]